MSFSLREIRQKSRSRELSFAFRLILCKVMQKIKIENTFASHEAERGGGRGSRRAYDTMQLLIYSNRGQKIRGAQNVCTSESIACPDETETRERNASLITTTTTTTMVSVCAASLYKS